MRVATFNIHHGTVGTDGPVDPGRLAEVCASFDADVLALQEVEVGTFRTWGVDLVGTVARRCGASYVVGPARRWPGGYQANALLVRGAIGSSPTNVLPRVPAWKLWQERRTVLQADVVVDGATWTVATTHLAVDPRVNGRQLAHTAGLVGARLRTVLLGDFNRVPEDVGAPGLRTVEHGPTYPASSPQVAIDHVLVSGDVTVGPAEVRRTEMSDHAALVVDLTEEVR